MSPGLCFARRGYHPLGETLVAALATDTVIVYFKNVVQAFAARWKQLGGKVVALSDSNGYIHDPEGITPAKLAIVQRLKEVERKRIDRPQAPIPPPNPRPGHG